MFHPRPYNSFCAFSCFSWLSSFGCGHRPRCVHLEHVDVVFTIRCSIGFAATFMAMNVGCCMPCGSFVPNQHMPPVGPDGEFIEGCNDCGGYHAAHGDFHPKPQHTMPAPSPPAMLGRFHAVPTDDVFGLNDLKAEVTAYAETQPELGIQMPTEPPKEPGQFKPQPSGNPPPSENADQQSLLAPVATIAKKPKTLRRRKMPPNSIRLADWVPGGTPSSGKGSSGTDRTPLATPATDRASTKSPFLTAAAIPQKDLRSASTRKPEWKPVR